MTKTLTEQWKDGELDMTHYYVLLTNGRICRCLHTGSKIFMRAIDGVDVQVKEVLAPVPRYDEYKRLQERLEIATKALKDCYNDMKYWAVLTHRNQRILSVIKKALKEMEGVK